MAGGLEENASYCFRVMAINSSGSSAWSAPAVFTTGRYVYRCTRAACEQYMWIPAGHVQRNALHV
jgi:hypothetical protein